MATGVQLYFAHRVWVAFGRPLWLAIPFGILIGFTFCGGITSGVLSYQAGSAANVRGQALQSFQPDSTPWQWSVVFATWLISSTVIDVSLCALLFVHLSRMKSRKCRTLIFHVATTELTPSDQLASALSILCHSPCCRSSFDAVYRDVSFDRRILPVRYDSVLDKSTGESCRRPLIPQKGCGN